MAYRTKTYIAADWTGDKDAVDQLHKWNDSEHWSLSFTDAHDLTQAKDDSLNCNIKKSLKTRLDATKTFVLIVGDGTKGLRSGACYYCPDYNLTYTKCTRGYTVDNRSYVDFECAKAIEAGIKIVVLYNSTKVDKTKCPSNIQNYGTHKAMCYSKDGKIFWDYHAVKAALES